MRAITTLSLLVTAFVFTVDGLTYEKFQQKLKTFQQNPAEIPDINFGFEGIVTEEDWERRMVKDTENPVLVAKTLNSTLTGRIMMSYYMKPIRSFQGMPYAQSPPPRFQPPLPLNDEHFGLGESFSATHLPEKCSQHSLFTPSIPAGSEDCLYLNVYTRQIPDENNNYNTSHPVMIFYHGGAFLWGDSSLYLPTRLLDEEVILVVPHYRLGSFGFFSTNDDRAPGNTALYDQQMAMRWVQEHISDFGGDRDRVTIFGQSAGSASVNYHMIIPSSEGLFHGAIAESGSAIDHWAMDPDAIDSAFAIGEINGCNTSTIDTIYDCMIALDEEVITMGISELSKTDRVNGGMGFRGVAPIIQGKMVTDPLVSMNPADAYKAGMINPNVNLMGGANKHEGSFILGIMYTSYFPFLNVTDIATYTQEQMVTDLLSAFGIDEPTHAIAESMWEQFMQEADRTDFDSCTPGMIDFAGVLFEKSAAWETAKLHSFYSSDDTNTFFYSFDFESDDTMFPWLFIGAPVDIPFEGGVTHSDELMYIFDWPAIMDGFQVTIKDRLVTLWTNFAKYYNPTPPEEMNWKNLNIPEWTPFNINSEKYMLMQHDFTVNQQYPDRWNVSVDDLANGGTSTSSGSTTSMASSTTSDPNGTSMASSTTSDSHSTSISPNGNVCVSQKQYDEYEQEKNDLESEKTTYLIVMIVFIVLFVISDIVSCTLYGKWKKATKEIV